MLGFTPSRPTSRGGDDRETRFMQWVYDTLLSLRPNPTPNALTNSTTKGFYSIPLVPAGAKAEAITVEKMTLVSVDGNYLNCTRPGGGGVAVAKPPKLRNSVTAEVIEMGAINLTITYIYVNAQKRTASAAIGGPIVSENQVIVPRYLVGDAIFAVKPTSSGVIISGSPDFAVQWQDLNVDGRAWAKEFQ